MSMRKQLVGVGASWGGLDALRTILSALPADLPAPVVVAQHRSAESHPTALRELLGAATRLHVCEAEDKEPLLDGTVYLAPPDYHVLIEEEYALALSTDGPVMYARPSVDVLLESAAEVYRERCVGVVLTGANADGARGLARVRELGGATLVQDPDTAARPEMPRAALAAVPDAHCLPVEELGAAVVAALGATVST